MFLSCCATVNISRNRLCIVSSLHCYMYVKKSRAVKRLCLLCSRTLLFMQKAGRFDFFHLAESKGFEPSKRFRRLHDFQSCSFDQLGQLSIRKHRRSFPVLCYYIGLAVKNQGVNKIFFLHVSSARAQKTGISNNIPAHPHPAPAAHQKVTPARTAR